MKIAITGASGTVGRFITRAALAAGHEVTTLGRTPVAPDRPNLRFQHWTLGEAADLAGQDALIHAAFRHLPGRYRGGEGDDPAGFRRENLDGSLRLAEAAAGARVGRMLFLSSRAVFDGYPAGTRLTEDLPVAPDSLYGEVKVAVEDALATMNGPTFRTVSLRATGVYGQPPGGAAHKWAALFAAFLRGEAIAPRIGTEVHGDDLARATLALLDALAPQDGAAGTEDRTGGAPPEADGSSVGLTGPNGVGTSSGYGASPGYLDLGEQDPTAGAPIRGDRRSDSNVARLMRSTPAAAGLPFAAATRSAADQIRPGGGGQQGAGQATADLHLTAVDDQRDVGPGLLDLPKAVHISDLILDHRDLLTRLAAVTCITAPDNLPDRSDAASVSVLDCATLRRLGWSGGGLARLDRSLVEMASGEDVTL